MSAGEDFITILTCCGADATAQKVIIADTSGAITKVPYNSGYQFVATECKLTSKQDLYDTIQMLMTEPKSVVVRGKSRLLGLPIVRRSNGPDATFDTAAHRWLLIDLDDIIYPDNMDVNINPYEVIAWVKSFLPHPLNTAECLFKFSSSQNVPRDHIHNPIAHKLYVHLWFWMGDFYDDEYIKFEAALYNTPLDPSLYSAVQQHYIATPKFVGLADPIKQRWGIC